MKKIILLLILTASTVFSSDYLFMNIKKADKILEAMSNTPIVLEAKIESIEQMYINKYTLEEIKENEITLENLGKIRVIREMKLQVIELFKGELVVSSDNVYIYLIGGCITLNGSIACQTVSHTAYPLLDIGDRMIMGLQETNDASVLNKVIKRYSIGYKFKFGNKLQLPTSKDMLTTIEEAKLFKIMGIILRERARSLENEYDGELEEDAIINDNKVTSIDDIPDPAPLNEYPSIDDLEYNYYLALAEIGNAVDERLIFIDYIKSELRRIYE